jgi:Flp pilus assembly protein TadB
LTGFGTTSRHNSGVKQVRSSVEKGTEAADHTVEEASVDMSPESGARRRSPQLILGWVALAVLVVAVALLFVMEHLAFVFLAIGAVMLGVCFVLELRTRRAATREGTAFEEGGTFGGRRSPQTHTHM